MQEWHKHKHGLKQPPNILLKLREERLMLRLEKPLVAKDIAVPDKKKGQK
jgi:hypothetical protein